MDNNSEDHYQFSGIKQGFSRNKKYYRQNEKDKISGRRGRDDRPKDYASKEKIRKLNDRRAIRKNLENKL